jgi:hypothetical protein
MAPVSIAVCVVATTGTVTLGFYHPVVVLLVLTVTTAIGGVARCGYLAHRAEQASNAVRNSAEQANTAEQASTS